ncbi:unnamed protein product [Closterium sp. NIES-64]|nr:unnamed protein product [Closterium sp. NIES-64]
MMISLAYVFLLPLLAFDPWLTLLPQASLGEAAKDHERVVLKVRQVEFPEDSDDSDDDDNSDDSNDSDENDDDGKGKAGKGALKSKSFAVGLSLAHMGSHSVFFSGYKTSDSVAADSLYESTSHVHVGVLVKGRVDFAAMDHIFDRQFSLAHTGSHSVFFSGFKTSDATGFDSLYDDDEEIEEDEEEDEEEDSDEDDDEEEEDEEDEAMEGSDDEEAAAAAMAAEKSSKGMAAAAAAAVEKRGEIRLPSFSVAIDTFFRVSCEPVTGSKRASVSIVTPPSSKCKGEKTERKKPRPDTPSCHQDSRLQVGAVGGEEVMGSKRAAESIVNPPSSKGKAEKTGARKKPRPDTPAAIKTAGRGAGKVVVSSL